MYLVAVEAVVVAIAAVVVAVAAAVVAIAVVVAVPIIAVAVAERQPRSILTFRFNGLLWICLAVTVIL